MTPGSREWWDVWCCELDRGGDTKKKMATMLRELADEVAIHLDTGGDWVGEPGIYEWLHEAADNAEGGSDERSE